MNVNDTEIVWSILKSNGYKKAETEDSADVVLLMAYTKAYDSRINFSGWFIRIYGQTLEN